LLKFCFVAATPSQLTLLKTLPSGTLDAFVDSWSVS